MSEMCCPIKVGTKIIGILNASSTVPGALDRSDLLVLETVADHIAQAVENARNLEESARMREDLARMVIHDLRNPLTVIETTLNYIENILNAQEGSGLTDKTRRYVENAKAACERLFVMINGMLELQRIEAGELELDSMPAIGAEIVNDVVETLSIVASAMQVELLSDVREKGLMVYIDRELITRVLENLVANALKFTPEGGKVTVNASAAPRPLMDERLPHVKEGVLFTVRDTGPGVRLADRERIFERFARAETGMEDRRRGSGLGLAFCKEAIRAHGGAIWVESEPGRGATFCFVIPRVMGSLWP
jgi:signal transduction histidine kinase